MVKLRNFQVSWITLLLCLCLGSLVILPINNVIGLSVLDIAGSTSENYNLFDQAEVDDDLFVAVSVSVTIAGFSLSKSRQNGLNFSSVFLSPVSPPPKSA